jgi:hypothetical protein
VLGLGLGVIFQGLAQGLRVRRDAAVEVRIAVVAERVLNELLARPAAPESPEEGEEDGVRWCVEAIPPRTLAAGENARPQRGPRLLEVRVTLAAAGRDWELTTLLPQTEEGTP